MSGRERSSAELPGLSAFLPQPYWIPSLPSKSVLMLNDASEQGEARAPRWRVLEMGFWGMLAFQLGLAIYASLTTHAGHGDFIGAPMAGAPLALACGVAVATRARRNLGPVWPGFLMRQIRGYVSVLGVLLFLVHLDATGHADEA